MDEFTTEEDREDAIAIAIEDDQCFIGEDEECLVHHSYENEGGKCLWYTQHIEEQG